mmetsp:Transcript_46947/g.69487  ORF Transcript_46947/g.69487 Transcript_46947/m.69487 type:complete len:188 (+) Transcript_46947:159-722(+)|eukprot:CAMPEP_0195513890 /NCGR_PEP_ID=MMETSP0794_2-20130614/5445_1 /TAXON_ID=515487 /ORGANISM="Stephanopyxis turris, Strain CCMP 815" /LENGTH=187 /DNA_ID=CAMNT_0040642017 /DNA_START=154 /DNA_END=717 /DNA_ORIENTATION=-
MTVHSLHIFDRKGKTLFTKRYSPAVMQAQQSNGEMGDEEQMAEQRKLVFGMLFSLGEQVGSLAPEGEKGALHTVRTGASTLHAYETTSGLRFAMYTDNNMNMGTIGKSGLPVQTTGREALQHIYREIWVEYVVRSPLYRPGELEAPGESGKFAADGSAIISKDKFDIRSTNFEKKLDAYLTTMQWFR